MEELDSPVVKKQIEQVKGLSNIVSKLADYAIDKLTEYAKEVTGRDVSPDEVLKLLDQHPEILSFELLDEAIAKDWKVKALVNTALKLAGVVVRSNNGWVQELRTNGTQLFLQMIKFRKDLYELLKDKPNLVEFLVNYIIYKLGV